MLVNYSGREINAKLVYYGPGLSGKTTNLEYIYSAIPQTHRGKMVSMKTKTERTLFFDFLPIHLGELSGFRTRFLLYTVPGQVYYNATRKLVLKGVDAVVFVADSARGKMDENIESLQNLRSNLEEHGLSLDRIPWIIQYNKRDLPDIYTIEELERVLNPRRIPSFEAVAATGQGVFDSFKAIARMLLKHLSSEIGVQVVASPGGPAAGESGQDEGSVIDRVRSSPSLPPVPDPVTVPKEIEITADQPTPPAEPVIPLASRDLPPRPEPREETAAEPAEGSAATGAEQDRVEGVGERLRRWLAGSRTPEEGAPVSEIVSKEPAKDSMAPPGAAVPRLDAIGEPAFESAPEPESQPEREPAAEAPGPEPEPRLQKPDEAPSDAAPKVEAAFRPSLRPPDPGPSEIVEEPEVAAESEPETRADAARPVAFSIAVPPSRAAAGESQEDQPMGRFREVPILVDLDPEDLEAGVVLKLRIAVRRHGARNRDRQGHTWVDRAA